MTQSQPYTTTLLLSMIRTCGYNQSTLHASKLSTLEKMCVHTHVIHLQCSSQSNVKLCTVANLNLKQALSAPSIPLRVRHEGAEKPLLGQLALLDSWVVTA